MQNSKFVLLPKEQLEDHVSQIDLLLGMYPADDEVNLDTTTKTWLYLLRDWLNDESTNAIDAIPATLSFSITIDVEMDENSDQQKIQLSIDVPVRSASSSDTTNEKDATERTPSSIRVRLRQPAWMTRTQTSTLNATIPSDLSDLFSIIEYFRTSTSPYLLSTTTDPNPTAPSQPSTLDPLVRVWFYFPSLSTRSKREDLVNHAPHYSLTGFVLAGKPGILCLEGQSRDIDEYMRFIKTESWGDIPSHHKKVSERLREVVRYRVFDGMQEVTDAEWMGEKRGERGNRSDLRYLEGWLEGRGLRGVVGRVLM